MIVVNLGTYSHLLATIHPLQTDGRTTTVPIARVTNAAKQNNNHAENASRLSSHDSRQSSPRTRTYVRCLSNYIVGLYLPPAFLTTTPLGSEINAAIGNNENRFARYMYIDIASRQPRQWPRLRPKYVALLVMMLKEYVSAVIFSVILFNNYPLICFTKLRVGNF